VLNVARTLRVQPRKPKPAPETGEG
jgi:hypothetical protein